MEVSFQAGERSSEVVPVSFETVVTETGVLQLWCVARDGRRWKLEFNVREKVERMKIGIDLGTTNSALAYIDEREAEDREFPAGPHFRNAATGGRRARRSRGARCPRSCFSKTGSRWASTRASRARWCPRGWCTRPNRGSRTPMWTAPPRSCRGIRRRPGACSRRWKFRRASSPSSARSGTARMGAPLAEQDIVLTVPASFDEEARELTVMAARDAGLERLTLLEEPAAAFYSWIANNLAQSRKKLFDGQIVLVCDVGGGTSDFSLIRVSREGDLVELHAHRGGQAPAAGRRQPRSHAGLAGRNQAGRAAFHPPAQRTAPPVLGGQGDGCSTIPI